MAFDYFHHLAEQYAIRDRVMKNCPFAMTVRSLDDGESGTRDVLMVRAREIVKERREAFPARMAVLDAAAKSARRRWRRHAPKCDHLAEDVYKFLCTHFAPDSYLVPRSPRCPDHSDEQHELVLSIGRCETHIAKLRRKLGDEWQAAIDREHRRVTWTMYSYRSDDDECGNY